MFAFLNRIIAVATILLSYFRTLLDLVQKMTASLTADARILARGIAVCILITLLIVIFGWNLQSVPHPPDRGPRWYYWILRDPTFTTRAAVWTLYLTHQILHLATVHYALQSKIRYSSTLRPINIWLICLNLFFIFAHFVQTHVTYDGLAQDLPLIPSLGLAGVMLTWVLLMENNRRGLWFHYRFPFPSDLIKFARKYHGYYFSVAIVAVFWFHPLESTLGHLTGVFYNLLLLLQSCLVLTPIHYNRYWTFTLEFFVIVHGTVVGYFDPTKSWTIYFFWFLVIFVTTQMHGLNLSFSFKLSVIILTVLSIKEMFHIEGPIFAPKLLCAPLTEYVCVYLLAGLLWLIKTVFKIEIRLRSTR